MQKPSKRRVRALDARALSLGPTRARRLVRRFESFALEARRRERRHQALLPAATATAAADDPFLPHLHPCPSRLLQPQPASAS